MKIFENSAFLPFMVSISLILVGTPLVAFGEEADGNKIVGKLEQIVALRQNHLEWQKTLAAGNRSSDVPGAEIALFRARLALAHERGDLKKALEQLKRIESLLQRKCEEMERLREMGRDNPQEAMERKIQLLNAQIERERIEIELDRARSR